MLVSEAVEPPDSALGAGLGVARVAERLSLYISARLSTASPSVSGAGSAQAPRTRAEPARLPCPAAQTEAGPEVSPAAAAPRGLRPQGGGAARGGDGHICHAGGFFRENEQIFCSFSTRSPLDDFAQKEL